MYLTTATEEPLRANPDDPDSSTLRAVYAQGLNPGEDDSGDVSYRKRSIWGGDDGVDHLQVSEIQEQIERSLERDPNSDTVVVAITETTIEVPREMPEGLLRW